MFFSGGVVLPKNSSLVASAWQETDARTIEARPSPNTIRFKRALSTTLKPGNDANTDGSYHAKTKFIKTIASCVSCRFVFDLQKQSTKHTKYTNYTKRGELLRWRRRLPGGVDTNS